MCSLFFTAKGTEECTQKTQKIQVCTEEDASKKRNVPFCAFCGHSLAFFALKTNAASAPINDQRTNRPRPIRRKLSGAIFQQTNRYINLEVNY